ncbi:uncharacterized protein EV420DRAFT_1472560 [Desarmillaria tabescens]|uniref:Carbohydrate-binding module family 50 protein n=1 Tax=Armillaria tabescens TaxID=1929756 RepID=A0AA39U8A7_ARMTA|nr:uncharacterized protein EV420DRAFT_1472560 [Desarmillaria tabescens]KAK0469305.1 hypothetical protein EV420DRAFT_1472560 [Desarmillaria tabescens]
MVRWSQYNEDSYRLPEGFRRIGYDADTMRYTFSDKRGKLYQSPPGEEYGTLTPVISTSTSRPEAFYSDRTKPKVSVSTSPAAKTFHDFLPSSAITSPSSSSDRNSLSPPSPGMQFVNAARRTALPKMQGVVQSLRRSTTSANKSGHSYDDERRGLLRIPSTSTTASSVSASTVGRSKSSATQRSQYQYTKTHSRKSSV